MTQIRMAHLRIQHVNVAIFEANARDGSESGRAEVLADLTRRARMMNLRVDKSALAYGRHFYGTPDLVRYLSRSGIPRWTHTLSVGT